MQNASALHWTLLVALLAAPCFTSAHDPTSDREPVTSPPSPAITTAPHARAQERAQTRRGDPELRGLHDPVISADGAWVAAEERGDRGDGDVRVWSTERDVTYTIERGQNPRISRDSRWVSALLKPPLGGSRIAGPKNERAGRTLVLLDTQDGSRRTFDFVLSYDVTYYSSYLAYLRSPETKADGEGLSGDNAAAAKEREVGTLHMVELERDRVFTWENVVEYAAHQQTTDPYAHVAFVSHDEETGRDSLEVAVVGYAKVGWGTRGSYDGEKIEGLRWARDPITLGFLDSTEATGKDGKRRVNGALYMWHVPARSVHGKFTRVDTPH